jgi:type III pantothenate kinase
MTLLALDVGNTRLKWALYEAPRVGGQPLVQGAQFLENIEKLAEGDWSALPAPTQVLGCVVAGDAVKRRVEEQLEHWDVTPQWVVSSAAEAGVSNGYDHPARLGSDRWVAVIGARQRLLQQGPARPCIVVMVGTAVTVEAVDASGRFLGGIILPGHGIMLRALEGLPACTCPPARCAISRPTPAMRSPAAGPSRSPAPCSAWWRTCSATVARCRWST